MESVKSFNIKDFLWNKTIASICILKNSKVKSVVAIFSLSLSFFVFDQQIGSFKKKQILDIKGGKSVLSVHAFLKLETVSHVI